jgi:hypothetical protein
MVKLNCELTGTAVPVEFKEKFRSHDPHLNCLNLSGGYASRMISETSGDWDDKLTPEEAEQIFWCGAMGRMCPIFENRGEYNFTSASNT